MTTKESKPVSETSTKPVRKRASPAPKKPVENPAPTRSASPYERILLKLLEALEDASPCASACFRAAVVFLIAWAMFSIADPTTGLSPLISDALKMLVILLVLGYVIFHCINGFNPTFCMSKGPRHLNDEFARRLEERT